jgi:hypothetical protein
MMHVVEEPLRHAAIRSLITNRERYCESACEQVKHSSSYAQILFALIVYDALQYTLRSLGYMHHAVSVRTQNERGSNVTYAQHYNRMRHPKPKFKSH